MHTQFRVEITPGSSRGRDSAAKSTRIEFGIGTTLCVQYQSPKRSSLFTILNYVRPVAFLKFVFKILGDGVLIKDSILVCGNSKMHTRGKHKLSRAPNF